MADIRLYLESIGILDGSDNLATDALTNVRQRLVDVGVLDANDDITLASLTNILDVNDDVEAAHLGNAVQDPGTTTANVPAFATWTQVSTDRPAFVQLEVRVETDGTNPGQVAVDIDESGGTTADRTYDEFAPGALTAGDGNNMHMLLYLPPGAQYQVRNVLDPNATNSIELANEIVG